MALVETDIKRIIAYSSVSQMGYILFALGTLTFSGIMGATLHVIYHAIVKALLFCCVGWIIKATGKRDIRTISGLGKTMPLLSACTLLGTLAIAGVPALALFNSEWLIFSSGFQTPYLSLAILEVLGSLLTVAYILRFVGQCFFVPGKSSTLNPVPLSMKIATVSLSILTVITGFFPEPLFNYVVNELPFILGGGWIR
jgi:NADH-quinone oxidoreductase subunit M